MNGQSKVKRNKETICATVSPYVKKRVLECVAEEEFSSMSDLVSVAVTEFIARHDAEKQKNPNPKETIYIQEERNKLRLD